MGGIGYLVQENVWQSVVEALQSQRLEGTVQEYFYNPYQGWGEDGYGFSARLRVCVQLAACAQRS